MTQTNPHHNCLPDLSQPAFLADLPHAWRAGSLGRQALECQARQMMLGASFDDQRLHFATHMLQTYRQQPALDRLMRDQGRASFLAFSLYLHHNAHDTGGINYTRLLALFEQGRHTEAGIQASPTRIKALLMLWRMSGHLRQVPKSPASDNRSKTLEPTDKLLQAAQHWLRGSLISLDSILPLAAPVEMLMATPGLLAEMLSYSVLAYLHDRFTLHESFQCVQRLMQRDCGHWVLLTLIKTMQRDPKTGRWHADAQPHGLSKNFRISRGTVRNALADCAAKGWIVQQTRGGHDWLLSDTFAQQCRRWAAYEMVWTAAMANAAFMRLASHSEALLERKVG
jgi:hypothetical protein